MHTGHGEVRLAHLVGEPVDLATGVAEDHGLCDGQGVVEITESIELPFFLLDSNEILLNSFQGQFITLNQHAHGVGHELGGHVEDIIWEGSGNHDNLCGRREVTVDVVDLFAESTIEKFVGFIEHQHLDVACAQVAPADHICHTTWCSRNNMLAVIKLPDVFTNICSSNASMTLDVHIITKGHHDGLNLGCKFASRGKDKSCESQPPRQGLPDKLVVDIPWLSRTTVSITWRILIANVAVLPVPDCAWAMVSRPLQTWTIARD